MGMTMTRFLWPALKTALLVGLLAFMGTLMARAQSSIDWQMECPSAHLEIDKILEPTGEINYLVTCFLAEEPAATNTPEPTDTAEPTATDTPVPPTATPTDEPTATPEPVANGVPNPDDPACVSHDDRNWHGLYDPARDCHYDHAHGMPKPSWAADLFGAEIADLIWTVSYPWQTPQENELKHAGYVQHAYDFRGQGCFEVDAYVAQTHGLGIGAGKLARVHSFALAASLCNSNGPAGLIFTAGHEDYGQLISPYKKNFVSYPRFPEQLYDIGLPPYVGEADPDSDAQKETWNSATRSATRPHVDEHEIAGIAFRIRNAVDFVDPETRLTGDPVFVVIDEPENNSSAYQLYQIEINVPDINGDGSPVTGSFFTDVRGNLRSDCTVAGPDCVPLILIDAIPGNYSVNTTSVGLIDSTHLPGSYYDHDVWFCGDEVCEPHSSGSVPSGWIDLSGFGQ